jgi:uncharacterized membrane protein YidH (DUF202 family)
MRPNDVIAVVGGLGFIAVACYQAYQGEFRYRHSVYRLRRREEPALFWTGTVLLIAIGLVIVATGIWPKTSR